MSLSIVSNATLLPCNCLLSFRRLRTHVHVYVCIRTPVWARGEGRRHTTSRRDWLQLQWEGGMLSCYHGNTSSGCHGDETRHRLLDRSYYYNSSRCIAWRHLPPSPGCDKLTTSTCLYSPLRDHMYAYSSRKKHTGGTVRSTVSVLLRFKNMAPKLGSVRKFRLTKLKKMVENLVKRVI